MSTSPPWLTPLIPGSDPQERGESQVSDKGKFGSTVSSTKDSRGKPSTHYHYRCIIQQDVGASGVHQKQAQSLTQSLREFWGTDISNPDSDSEATDTIFSFKDDATVTQPLDAPNPNTRFSTSLLWLIVVIIMVSSYIYLPPISIKIVLEVDSCINSVPGFTTQDGSGGRPNQRSHSVALVSVRDHVLAEYGSAGMPTVFNEGHDSVQLTESMARLMIQSCTLVDSCSVPLRLAGYHDADEEIIFTCTAFCRSQSIRSKW
ncbi:hypothetical protein SISSUDRAFT_1036953 [Sistotremastrum suecicum HHB10207 ss-3]|uniref:Uncharacterized protein n=1 Tax=Sistotremastrum suecicum HHB10207 ss-3 TaxID=1314776 RepID=A0A165YSA1_9AGAM|nr:hypothetical protein SISSUDRAFT_1036953 [Sistotremastrum suecicum HHB10207 ss-3]